MQWLERMIGAGLWGLSMIVGPPLVRAMMFFHSLHGRRDGRNPVRRME